MVSWIQEVADIWKTVEKSLDCGGLTLTVNIEGGGLKNFSRVTRNF